MHEYFRRCYYIIINASMGRHWISPEVVPSCKAYSKVMLNPIVGVNQGVLRKPNIIPPFAVFSQNDQAC